MANALDAAHRAGVIHRDFKPSNVMLVGSGGSARAVVTDFGLARRATVRGDSTATITGQLMGTVDYMAPELFTGGEASVASDIYALGLVGYEMVAGRKPFEGRTPLEAAMKRMNEPAPVLEQQIGGMDPGMRRVILRCLERDPAKRFASAGEMVEALGGESTGAPPAAGRFLASGRKVWARRAAMLGAGVLALAAVVLGARELSRHRPPAESVRWYERGLQALRDGTPLTAMNALQRAVEFDQAFVLAHARLAEAATELDYMDKAKSEMLRASPTPWESWLAPTEDGLRLEALHAVLVNDFAGAAQKYAALANKAVPEEKAAVLVDLGRAYEGGGKVQEALKSYGLSIGLASQYAAAFLRRGTLEAKQRQNSAAAADFDSAERLFRTEGNAEGLNEVFYQRTALARRTGKIADARALAEKTLGMARANSDDYHQIRALLMLSYLEYSTGDTDGGQQRANEAGVLARRVGLDVLAASGLVDVGSALFNKGDYAAAETYLRDAMEIARRYQAVRVEARAELPLGQLLTKQGRAEEGLEISRSALNDFERLGDKSNAAQAAIPVARDLRDAGEYEQAATVLREQLKQAEQLKDDGGILTAARELGTVLLLEEQYPAALADFDRAAQGSHATGNVSYEAYSNVGRADVLRLLGRYQEAEEALGVADALNAGMKGNRPLTATENFSRAEMDLGRQRLAELQRDLNRMKGETGALAASVKRLGCLLRVGTGRAREGLLLCEEAVADARTLRNFALLKNSELALARARLAAGDKAGALAVSVSLVSEFHGKGQMESELSALAVAIEANSPTERAQYEEAVQADLAALRRLLGDGFREFTARPDIQQILRRAAVKL